MQVHRSSRIVSIVRGFQSIFRRIGGVTVRMCAPPWSASFTSIMWRVLPTMIFDARPSRSRMSRTASPAAMETGFPPNVKMCSNEDPERRNASRCGSRTATAPSGA